MMGPEAPPTTSIFALMHEGLVELNLQRQQREIIIYHLGSQQNRWHHPALQDARRRWTFEEMKLWSEATRQDSSETAELPESHEQL